MRQESGIDMKLAKRPEVKPVMTSVIFGSLFLALASIAIWLYSDLAESHEQAISSRTEIARQQSQFMSQWLGTSILATDYVLRDINEKITPEDLARIKSSQTKIAETSAWLEKKRLTAPNVKGISVFGKECIFESAADKRVIGFRSNQRACVDRSIVVEDKMYLQYVPAEKSANKRPSILVSRYHISPDGKILGGVLAAIDLSYAENWITSFKVSKNDVLAVIDGEGVLLARNPPLAGVIGKKWPMPAEAARLDEAHASAVFSGTSPLDGRERLFGISKMQNIPIVIIVGLDKEETLKEWLRRSIQLSVGFMALSVLSVIVFFSYLSILKQRNEMGRLATTDSLTHISNRRALMNAGEREFNRQNRYKGAFSALMIDIDRFKGINDKFGHPTGDKVIRSAAEIIASGVRNQDMVGRVGGEEFAVLLPETDLDGATTIAERIRTAIEQAIIRSDGDETVQFTISIGVATHSTEDQSFQQLLGRADKGLYQAKAGGRNRVVRS